jgi:hypothetical protein
MKNQNALMKGCRAVGCTTGFKNSGVPVDMEDCEAIECEVGFLNSIKEKYRDAPRWLKIASPVVTIIAAIIGVLIKVYQ